MGDDRAPPASTLKSHFHEPITLDSEPSNPSFRLWKKKSKFPVSPAEARRKVLHGEAKPQSERMRSGVSAATSEIFSKRSLSV